MPYLVFIVAVFLSAISAYYSVMGMVAIFAASPIAVAMMASGLEAAKLVTASWLYRNWKIAPLFLKVYLSIAVVILMLITSMGCFGYLSRAHSDQILVSGDSVSKVQLYDEQIKTSKENIEANRKALKQMDEGIDQVMARSTDSNGAEKAVTIRRGQTKERQRLLTEIETEQKEIVRINKESAPIRAEVRKIEAEVGPIKYIAKLIYGDNPDANILEKAVTWVILLLISVFDPLAVLLLIASSLSFANKAGLVEIKEKSSASLMDMLSTFRVQLSNQIDNIKSKLPKRSKQLKAEVIPMEAIVPKKRGRKKRSEKPADLIPMNTQVADSTEVNDQGDTITVDLIPTSPVISPEQPKSEKKTRKKPAKVLSVNGEELNPETSSVEPTIVSTEEIIEEYTNTPTINKTKKAVPDVVNVPEKDIKTISDDLEELYKDIVTELAPKKSPKNNGWFPETKK